MRRFLFSLFLILFVPLALAQTSEEEERSGFISFVEDQLSAPGRQIRLTGLSGTLSSNVSIQRITISDSTGVWFEVENASLVWTRSALLRGRLQISELRADRIVYSRPAIPDESLPKAEARPFAIPELPIAVNLEKLEVPSISFGAPVFGLETELSVAGRMLLDGGSLDLALGMDRKDGATGRFDIVANYAADTKDLKLDVKLAEPENGVVANLLKIPGTPPVNLQIAGDAPLEQFDLNLAFDVAAQRILEGGLAIRRASNGLSADVDLSGPIGTIMPAAQRRFFGERSTLRAELGFADGGGVRIDTLDLKSGVVNVTGNAATLPDGFLSRLELNAELERRGVEPIELPFGEATATVDNARLAVSYGNGRDWTADLAVDNYVTPEIALRALRLDGGGTLSGPNDRAARQITFSAKGLAEGMKAKNAAIAQALGESVTLDLSGDWASGLPVNVAKLTIGAKEADFEASGKIDGFTFDGTTNIRARNLAAFSLLAGRDLAGSASLETRGTITPVSGAFDLTIDGEADALAVGIAQIDPLLEGTTRLSGRAARNEEGLTFDRFELGNEAFEATLDGRLSSQTADLGAKASLVDLALMTPDASGPVEAEARITGLTAPFDIDVKAAIPAGKLLGRDLKDAKLGFNGKIDGTDITGNVSGSGNYAGDDMRLAARITRSADTLSLMGLDAFAGPTRVTGDIAADSRRLITGGIDVSSPDIRSAAALALVDASGRVKGSLRLAPSTDGMQTAIADITGRNLVFDDNRVGSADVKAAIDDLFGELSVDATVDATDIRAGGVEVTALSGRALTTGKTTDFDVSAGLSAGARLTSKGKLERTGDGFRADLQTLTLTSRIANATLAGPATVTRQGTITRISPARINIGGGAVTVSGSAGTSLDLDLTVARFPLAIANAFRPDLGAAGFVDGSASITGPASNPSAEFRLSGSGVTSRQMAEVDLAPLSITASGSGSRGGLRLASTRIQNSQGLDISATGAIPFAGNGLNVTADGSAPLALAAPALAVRGTQVEGRVRFNIVATGSLAAPQSRGIVSIEGATISDPLTNIRLQNVNLMAGLQGDRIAINRFSAGFARGGTVSASGSISTAAGFPADIAIAIDGVTLTDAEIYRATVSGTLKLSGPLARDPLVSGNVALANLEITIPESFAGRSDLLDVDHVAPERPVRETLNRIERVTPKASPTARPSVVRLDIQVDAPHRIFVRGRGVDAELGGSLRLTGPVTNIEPVGAFRLIRGRFEILSKRLDLDEGSITFTGDLDPMLNLVARTSAKDADAFITLSGPASNPDITFSSQPELPQDEVLALIVFDRSISELSPIQIARLASIALELTGGRGSGIVGDLREGTGVDDLDVVTDDEGNAAVRAGRYISDNVYLGVEAGKNSKATINLDITENLKARGSVDTEGDSSIGVFFEKDY